MELTQKNAQGYIVRFWRFAGDFERNGFIDVPADLESSKVFVDVHVYATGAENALQRAKAKWPFLKAFEFECSRVESSIDAHHRQWSEKVCPVCSKAQR